MTSRTRAEMLTQTPIRTAALPLCSPLNVTECRSWKEVEAFCGEWHALLSSNPDLGIFCTPEWLGPWWNAYGQGRSLLVLIFADEQAQIVGIAPLYLQRSKCAGFIPSQFLRLLGDGSDDSDDLDFIVRPGYEHAVASAFLDRAEKKAWNLCELNCLSPRSAVGVHLLDELKVRHWKHVSRERDLVTVELPEQWGQFLEKLSSKERGKIVYFFRRLERRHQLRFRRCHSAADLPEYLDTLFVLHQKRWEARGQRGSFNLPHRVQFYLEMCPLLLDRDWLELWIMELDGVPVAAQIGLRYCGSVYALQEGFDPDYSGESVGYVLRAYVLRSCVATGIRNYEFLAGDEESKKRWGAQTGHYVDICFAHPGPAGTARMLASEWMRSSKGWLRQVLPAVIWKRLQWAKAKLQTG